MVGVEIIMMQAIVFAAIFAAANGCMYIIYGKKGLKQRAAQGKNNLILLIGLMMLLLIWGLSLLFLITGITAGDTALCIIIVLGVPVLIAALAIRTRYKLHSEQIEDADIGDESNNNVKQLKRTDQESNKL